MSTYDPESLDWKNRAEDHELPYAFQGQNSIEIASAIGQIHAGEFVPAKEVSKTAWVKLKVINRAVRLRRPVRLEAHFMAGCAKWSQNPHLDENGYINCEFTLQRTNPGSKFYYTSQRAYPLEVLSQGLETAVTSCDQINSSLESQFYCIPSQQTALSVRNSDEVFDVGILTIREEEYEAVLDRLPNSAPLNKPRQIYECATVPTAHGQSVRVAVARCLSQGQLEASMVAKQFIEEISPRWILLVGIAGGIPTYEFSLGDVVIASRYLDFSLAGAIEGSKRELNISGGPFHPDVEKLLKHLPADRASLGPWNADASINMSFPELEVPDNIKSPKLYGGKNWKEKVVESLRHHFENGSRPPQFHIGPTASSNDVVKDTELAAQWVKSARSVVNVETELAGVYQACHASQPAFPKIVAIRGISDIVGYRRSHEWLNYACQSAASFSISLIRAGLLKNAEHTHVPAG